MQLLSVMLGSFFTSQEITEEQIEDLKDRDTISEMMAEFAKHMPELKAPLIDERDRYLMSSIREAPGKTIVAVVGAGHVEGMVEHLHTAVDREQLSVIPPTSLVTRSLKWIIPAIILSAFYFGYQEHQGEALKKMLYAWIIPNSIGAAVFAAIAGATPLTVIVAAIASPITSLNPTIGAGMVAALVEAWRRRPTVEDCEGINDAILSLRGMYANPFTRVLLVAVGATLGSALGAYVGTYYVVKLL
jgi:pheromone shutdown-related protein TraB